VTAEKIARSARPFTDREFVRDCMQEVVKIMLPDKACLLETSASRETVLQEELKILVKINLDNYLLKQVNFNIFPWPLMKALT